LKPLLILLGLALVGYGLGFPIGFIDSPKSAWENTLSNYARRRDATGLVTFFNRNIIAPIRGGWTPVVILGVAMTTTAFFIKVEPKNGDHK